MKKWYLSKTVWFNILTVALGIMQIVSEIYVIRPDVLALAMGIGNFLLRFMSSTRIS